MYKILIVDDEENLLHATEEYLKLHGFSTFIASCPRNGLNLASTVSPDLIIVDILMPNIDGYAFINKLKAENSGFSTPFIFVTAKGMTQDRIKGYKLGCSAYLSKPFDPEELVVIVKNILHRNERTRMELKEITKHIKHVTTYLEEHYRCLESEKTHITLTPREKSVLQCIIKGLRNKEIAQTVNTSVRNIERYVSRLLKKTQTNNRTELVRYMYINYATFKANDGNRTRE